jgi:hypothetical protein
MVESSSSHVKKPEIGEGESAPEAEATAPRSLWVRAALGLIWFYQSGISPFTPKSCRFEPTCSHYMAQAIARYGVRRGGILGVKRVCRCHPWGAFGLDPVPDLANTSSGSKIEYSK